MVHGKSSVLPWAHLWPLFVVYTIQWCSAAECSGMYYVGLFIKIIVGGPSVKNRYRVYLFIFKVSSEAPRICFHRPSFTFTLVWKMFFCTLLGTKVQQSRHKLMFPSQRAGKHVFRNHPSIQGICFSIYLFFFSFSTRFLNNFFLRAQTPRHVIETRALESEQAIQACKSQK